MHNWPHHGNRPPRGPSASRSMRFAVDLLLNNFSGDSARLQLPRSGAASSCRGRTIVRLPESQLRDGASGPDLLREVSTTSS